MKICIVGHGKSLEGKGLGPLIDKADEVIRLKRGWELCKKNPADYGTRTDLLIASTETPGTFPIHNPEALPGACYFAYPKLGWYSDMVIREAERLLNRKIEIPLNLVNHWNWRFRKLGAIHPNVSLGMAAVIIFSHFIRPRSIILAGMDKIIDPSGEFSRIESIPRTGTGAFPTHDWGKEHVLLQILSEHCDFNYEPLHG